MHVLLEHRERTSVGALCLVRCDTPLIQQGEAESWVTYLVENGYRRRMHDSAFPESPAVEKKETEDGTSAR